ncbi:MAG: LLM class F420-dependent oxidoreductase [Candidatus Rokuibacteriota bacterium]|nr:MAG: LLM class F420-dependent oxidoreductase [Candidatus Rokubacteria bacterium]
MNPRGREIAVAIPQFPRGPGVAVDELQAFLHTADALGVHSLWVQEQVVGPHGGLEPLTLLAYAAAATRRPRLGVAVILTPLRSPVQLAKALASLDQLCAGRLIVGVGLGDDTTHYPAFGITPAARVRRFTEGLEVMTRLWTSERVTFAGRFWTLHEVAVAPRPAQRPHPPLWFGARHPDALRRAARLGQGFVGAGSSSTGEFREQVSRLRGFLAEERRDPEGFAIAKRLYLLVDPNRERGRRRLSAWFAAHYGDGSLADRVALVGTPEECVDGVREVQMAGARLVILNFLFDEQEHLERAAQEIIPHVT